MRPYLLPHSATAPLPPALATTKWPPPQRATGPAQGEGAAPPLRGGFPPHGPLSTAPSAPPLALPQGCRAKGSLPPPQAAGLFICPGVIHTGRCGRSCHSWRLSGRLTLKKKKNKSHVSADEGSKYLMRSSKWAQTSPSSKQPAPLRPPQGQVEHNSPSPHPADLLQPGRCKAMLPVKFLRPLLKELGNGSSSSMPSHKGTAQTDVKRIIRYASEQHLK